MDGKDSATLAAIFSFFAVAYVIRLDRVYMDNNTRLDGILLFLRSLRQGNYKNTCHKLQTLIHDE